MATDKSIFLMKVRSPQGKPAARLLIDSLRSFGGELSTCPIWLFAADPERVPCQEFEGEGVRVIPLIVPESVKDYLFGDKVYACARAEEMAPAGVESLIWIDPNCLVVQPPGLYAFGEAFDAAVRPVHIRNVGLPPAQALDGFWKGIYDALGVRDIDSTVETFVGGERLRTYFNSHAFAIRPATGLLSRWFEAFVELVGDREFQSNYCQDEPHRVFLFQAVLSALLAARLDADRIRILPPVYNYPYHLQASIPADRRAGQLNDLVTIAYEERSLDPDRLDDIEVREPLRSWLATRVHR